MSVRRADLGEPLTVGRSAEIFAWPEAPPDRVLKLFPAAYDASLVDAEEAISIAAHESGLTPIGCAGQVRVEDRTGLLFDRLRGDSLTRQAERNPLRLRSRSRVLAAMHARVHEVGGADVAGAHLTEIRAAAAAALETEPLAFLTPAERDRAEAAIAALPAGDRVLHLDFHPENVFAHDDAYAVIDWQTALRGDPAADVAMSVLLFSDAELFPGISTAQRLLLQSVRRIVLRTYRAEYQRLTGMTDARIDAWRLPVVVLRMSTLDIASERAGFRRELRTRLGSA